MISDFQNQIDIASANGGGTVTIPPGDHICGTLQLKDNVTLHLPEGARLIGSGELDDYPLPDNHFIDAMGEVRGRALIFADNAANIAITGSGSINGRGGLFPKEHPRHVHRPFLVRLLNCRNVRLSGVELREAAAWTCHLQGCDNVEITDLRIDSRVNHNNDGIDIDSCRHVRISNCDIITGDDAVCIKSTLPKPCEDIDVDHCRLHSLCATLKLGTESYGDMRNIRLRDCAIRHAGLGALKILSSDGAVISNVLVENIDVASGTGPIFIRLGDRCNVYAKDAPRRPAGDIRNILIRNFKATVTLPEQGVLHHWTQEYVAPRALSCISVIGIPSAKINDIAFENIQVEFAGRGVAEDKANLPTEQTTAYPELHHFGVLPASSFYLRHANRITVQNAHTDLREHDERPAVVAEDVYQLQLRGCEIAD